MLKSNYYKVNALASYLYAHIKDIENDDECQTWSDCVRYWTSKKVKWESMEEMLRILEGHTQWDDVEVMQVYAKLENMMIRLCFVKQGMLYPESRLFIQEVIKSYKVSKPKEKGDNGNVQAL